jgi:sugar phosphate isomerase/epimerase
MKLYLFRHLWGVEEPWETFFPKAKKLGYHGIETWVPEGKDRARMKRLLKENGLTLLAFQATEGGDWKEHAKSFERSLEVAEDFGAFQVNAHSGRDSFSFDDAKRFYERALKAEKKSGLLVSHETHRGRVFYNPWTTAAVVREFPEMNLNYDLSHWVCVTERMLDTEEHIVRELAKRVIHIHARVGYEEGPQVPDPRAPEYASYLEKHEAWWDLTWKAQKARGLKYSTLTPEFGPPYYLHQIPYTEVPVANLFDICEWQTKRQAQRFALKFG